MCFLVDGIMLSFGILLVELVDKYHLQRASTAALAKVFITQVGLYNDENELLAVAKLSKPILKSYSREAIIKVKLDF